MPKTHKLKPKTQTFLLLFLALTAGIFMGLTTSPVEAWPLAWIALAPLWVFVKIKAENRRRKDPQFFPKTFFLLPLLWGMGYHGTALFWITGIHPMTWMGVPWLASLAIALFCWLFITLWGTAIVIIWAVLISYILTSKPATDKTSIAPFIRILISVALWCSLEALFGWGPLYWTSISYTQSPHNLAILHLGQISGPLTVTAAIVAVNSLIGEAWINFQKQTASEPENLENNVLYASSAPLRLHLHWHYLSIAAGLLVSLHLVGFWLYSRPLEQPAATALKVGIIQGNIPNSIKLFIDGQSRALKNYTAGYTNLANRGVEAILTPEVALPFYLTDQQLKSFYSAILEKNVVAWVGAYGERGISYTNSLFTVTGTGEVFSRYDKVKLVPLGEYIPFEEVLGKLIDRLSPLNAHMAAGSAKQIFETPFGRAIVGICYESAFAEHFRRQAAAGGQFILTASNNAHYAASMPAQHHAQDVMRAIETDRWAVRATNTGYSGIVDPHGRTLWISGINTYEIHAATIHRRQSQTLYVRWGNWLTPVLLVLVAIAWFFYRRSPPLFGR